MKLVGTVPVIIFMLVTGARAGGTDSRWFALVSQGQQLQSQGRLTEAEGVLTRALAEAERFGKDSPQVAAVLDNLANVEVDLAHYLEAERQYRRSVAILEGTYGHDDLNTVAVLHDLAMMYLEVGDYEKARPALERVLDTRLKVGADPSRMAQVIMDLGSAYALENKHDTAEQMYLRALAILESHPGLGGSQVAAVLYDLACSLACSGKYTEALGDAERSRDLLQKADAPETDWVPLLSLLGILYARTGHPADAAAYARRALKTAENAYGPDHPRVASVLLRDAVAWRVLKHGKEANSMEKRARQILAKNGQENPLDYTVDANALGSKGRRAKDSAAAFGAK